MLPKASGCQASEREGLSDEETGRLSSIEASTFHPVTSSSAWMPILSAVSGLFGEKNFGGWLLASGDFESGSLGLATQAC